MSRHRSAALAASLCLFIPLAAPPLLAGSPASTASAGVQDNVLPLDVVVFDRTAGRTLPLHRHRGELYVAGEPGHEYEIRLRNGGDRRVLAVTSVDGVNVVTGHTAAPGQPGYVIDGWGSARIDGWRKSLGEVASFFFTTPRNSYAARTGRPDNIGVIGVAMFLEAPSAAHLEDPRRRDEDSRPRSRERAAQSPAAPAAAAEAGASSRRAPPSAAADSAEALAAAPRLGTGHGTRRDSPVTHTAFERASATPDAIVRIYYDSHRRLVARGIVEPDARAAQRQPEPFPGGFVPDPAAHR